MSHVKGSRSCSQLSNTVCSFSWMLHMHALTPAEQKQAVRAWQMPLNMGV